MKVLVLGATGFIGNSVANALVRAGHSVIAQTRDVLKWGKQLALNEMEIVESDPVNDDKWAELLPSVDVLVDCIGGLAPLANLSAKLVTKAENAQRHPTAAKLVYVWTSGVWIHGDDRFNSVTDGTETSHPPNKVAWRPAVEKQIVESSKIDGVVIRPGLVYGRQSNAVGMLFDQAHKGKIEWPGQPGGRYATVHVDDLGELYRLAVEKHPLVKGLRIEGSNFTTESVDTLLSQLCKLAKIENYSYKEPSNDFEKALSNTSIVRGTLGRSLLGWYPLKPSLIDGLPTYYAAHVAGLQ